MTASLSPSLSRYLVEGRSCGSLLGGDREKMDTNQLRWIFRAIFVVILVVITSASASSFLSDGVMDSSRSAAGIRSLLQTKQPCSVKFEFLNYTIITSRCKGPNYPRKACCDSFLQFACPYADEINDLNTDCASTMFSYIHLYGHYPAGLFANLCIGGERGLPCPANYTGPSAAMGTSDVKIARNVTSGKN